MSSFGENFERDDNNAIIIDGNAFYPFLETIIVLLIIFVLYKIYCLLFDKKDYSHINSFKYCSCKICAKRSGKLQRSNFSSKRLIFYIIILSLLILAFAICYKKILISYSKIKGFEPYEILEINPSASLSEVKHAYKRMALRYHPDKNGQSLQARAKFELVTKAYQSIINPDKDNEEIGRLSIGLPDFIVDKKKHVKIIIAFLIIFCIYIPYYAISWLKRLSLIDNDNILRMTGEMFIMITNRNFNIKTIPFIIGLAREYELIDDQPEKTAGEIEDLYYSYKEHFPKIYEGENENTKFYERIRLTNKKAIGILYAFTFGQVNNLNYQAMKLATEYLKTACKLIDIFLITQKEKLMMQNIFFKEKEKNPNVVFKFPEINEYFIKDIIIFRQCFIQGISICNLVENISYTQLPYIDVNNIGLITSSQKDTKLRHFLCMKNEDKFNFLKNIFKNFSKEQINDIIKASKCIPSYTIEGNMYVDGYQGYEYLVGDMVTFEFTIKRKEIENEVIGTGHSKCFPFLFNENLTVMIYREDKLLTVETFNINDMTSTYKFKIKISNEGIFPIKFIFYPACHYGIKESLDFKIESKKFSQKRKEYIENIDKRKEKIGLTFVQEILTEVGLMIKEEDEDEDEEEEKEDADDKKDDKTSNNCNNNNIDEENKENINITGETKHINEND